MKIYILVKVGKTMKKDVYITIKGIQKIENEKETTELFTQGLFYKQNNKYYIAYDDSETTGFENSKTTLKVEGEEKITLIRSGESKSHLIIENGQRNIGHYGTVMGDLIIGVSARQIKSDLTDNGGNLFFSYSLDVNSSLVSENEVYVTVKDN